MKPATNILATLLVGALAFATPAWAVNNVLRVDGDAAGGNGVSWDTAFNDLSAALAAAAGMAEGGLGVEVWVAAGTYKPAGPDGDRDAAFEMVDGVAIYGGFAGNEDSLAGRAGLFDETILSGDLNDDDPQDLISDPEDDNSYNVVRAVGAGPTAVLDGFTVTGGNAFVININDKGGGLRIVGGNPVVRNCTFVRNRAQGGGGVGVVEDGNPTLTNCTFRENFVESKAAGLYVHYSSATVTDCTFTDNRSDLGSGGGIAAVGTLNVSGCDFTGNHALNGGGAIRITGEESVGTITRSTFQDNVAISGGAIAVYSTVTIANCLFRSNHAYGNGGAVYNGTSAASIVNCAFVDNHANQTGGGLRITGCDSTITNCSFVGNQSDQGGGVYLYHSDPTITNCILWDNIAEFDAPGEIAQIHIAPNSFPVISHCGIQGLTGALGGEANTDAEPAFADGDPNLRLSADSPYIDAGSNAAVTVAEDLDGNPRVVDGDNDQVSTVDIGPYEWQNDDDTPPPVTIRPNPLRPDRRRAVFSDEG